MVTSPRKQFCAKKWTKIFFEHSYLRFSKNLGIQKYIKSQRFQTYQIILFLILFWMLLWLLSEGFWGGNWFELSFTCFFFSVFFLPSFCLLFQLFVNKLSKTQSQIEWSWLHRTQIMTSLLSHLQGRPRFATCNHVPSNIKLKNGNKKKKNYIKFVTNYSNLEI